MSLKLRCNFCTFYYSQIVVLACLCKSSKLIDCVSAHAATTFDAYREPRPTAVDAIRNRSVCA